MITLDRVARSTYDIDLLTTDRRALDRPVRATRPPKPVDIRRGDQDDPLAGVIRIAIGTDRPQISADITELAKPVQVRWAALQYD